MWGVIVTIKGKNQRAAQSHKSVREKCLKSWMKFCLTHFSKCRAKPVAHGMHKEHMIMKGQTIDELCKAEAGTFKKFIKKKEAHLVAIENERKERIRAS